MGRNENIFWDLVTFIIILVKFLCKCWNETKKTNVSFQKPHLHQSIKTSVLLLIHMSLLRKYINPQTHSAKSQLWKIVSTLSLLLTLNQSTNNTPYKGLKEMSRTKRPLICRINFQLVRMAFQFGSNMTSLSF